MFNSLELVKVLTVKVNHKNITFHVFKLKLSLSMIQKSVEKQK